MSDPSVTYRLFDEDGFWIGQVTQSIYARMPESMPGAPKVLGSPPALLDFTQAPGGRWTQEVRPGQDMAPDPVTGQPIPVLKLSVGISPGGTTIGVAIPNLPIIGIKL